MNEKAVQPPLHKNSKHLEVLQYFQPKLTTYRSIQIVLVKPHMHITPLSTRNRLTRSGNIIHLLLISHSHWLICPQRNAEFTRGRSDVVNKFTHELVMTKTGPASMTLDI